MVTDAIGLWLLVRDVWGQHSINRPYLPSILAVSVFSYLVPSEVDAEKSMSTDYILFFEVTAEARIHVM